MGKDQHIGYVIMFDYAKRPSHCNAHIWKQICDNEPFKVGLIENQDKQNAKF
jgi:hypothetical protein